MKKPEAGADAAGLALLYEFGDFRLNAASRRLSRRRDGAPVPLTAKACEALLFLVQHSGTVLDKNQLMEAIWPDNVVEENNLNQAISTLRRALGERPGAERRYIVTIPGQGYQFAAEVKTSGQLQNAVATSAAKTLAVLPFKPLVAETRDASLEMGMADTLIARLSSIRDYTVRPLSAVRRYVELEQEPLLAGRELGVAFILDGSIQKSGADVRVTVRLLHVASGEALWAGTFDEKFTDIFSVQDAIAERVVSALALGLNREEKQHLTKRDTQNPEAYQLYLKGRYYWWKTVPEEFRKSRDYFQRAVDADPSYALGYCGLNSFYGYGSAFGMLPPEEGWPRAIKANTRALELDNGLAQAHNDRGAYRMVYYRDWQGAEDEIRYAVELNPNYTETHYLYSFFLVTRRRFDEAIAEAKFALELDPLSLRLHQHLGTSYYYAQRYDEAVKRFQRTLELDADADAVHAALGDTFEQSGLHDLAIAHWEKASRLHGDDALATLLVETYRQVGFSAAIRAVAQERLQQLNHRRANGSYLPEIEFTR
ncbi:MAG: winged helix-turn-helix domain-containing protein, partial [Verrucomicrobia bacterium]|nr:winged helix-turn-helix domain-containing protein [Verrucomicrobiota bacterium]